MKFLLSVVLGSFLLCQSVLGNRREQNSDGVTIGIEEKEKSHPEKKYRVRIVNPKQKNGPQELTEQNEDGISNFGQRPLIANSPYTKKFQSQKHKNGTEKAQKKSLFQKLASFLPLGIVLAVLVFLLYFFLPLNWAELSSLVIAPITHCFNTVGNWFQSSVKAVHGFICPIFEKILPAKFLACSAVCPNSSV